MFKVYAAGKRLYWRYSEGDPQVIESATIDGTDKKRVRGLSMYYDGGLAILGQTLFISYDVTHTEW